MTSAPASNGGAAKAEKLDTDSLECTDLATNTPADEFYSRWPAHPVGKEEMRAAARDLGVPVKALRVLGHTNDPYDMGSAIDLQWADWFRQRWAEHGQQGMHLRTLHYRLFQSVTSDWPVISGRAGRTARPSPFEGRAYGNTIPEWEWLMRCAKQARTLFPEDVPPEALEDRRSDTPRRFSFTGPPEEPAIEVADDGSWAPPRLTGLWWPGAAHALPEITATGYETRQPYRVEIWSEKSSVEAELLPLARKYGADLVTGAGFASITRIVQSLALAIDDGRPLRVLWISDFDGGGSDMPTAMARQVQFHLDRLKSDLDVTVTPVAVTAEQAQHLPKQPAPPMRAGSAMAVRAAAHEAQHGGVVEIEAMLATPGMLTGIVEEAILDWYDRDLAGRVEQAQAEAGEVVRSSWAAATDDLARQVDDASAAIAGVLARFRPELRAIAERFDAEVREYVDAISAAVEEAQRRLDDFDPHLPAVPAGEVTGDPSAALFWSGRHWLDQLARFKEAADE